MEWRCLITVTVWPGTAQPIPFAAGREIHPVQVGQLPQTHGTGMRFPLKNQVLTVPKDTRRWEITIITKTQVPSVWI